MAEVKEKKKRGKYKTSVKRTNFLPIRNENFSRTKFVSNHYAVSLNEEGLGKDKEGWADGFYTKEQFKKFDESLKKGRIKKAHVGEYGCTDWIMTYLRDENMYQAPFAVLLPMDGLDYSLYLDFMYTFLPKIRLLCRQTRNRYDYNGFSSTFLGKKHYYLYQELGASTNRASCLGNGNRGNLPVVKAGVNSLVALPKHGDMHPQTYYMHVVINRLCVKNAKFFNSLMKLARDYSSSTCVMAYSEYDDIMAKRIINKVRKRFELNSNIKNASYDSIERSLMRNRIIDTTWESFFMSFMTYCMSYHDNFEDSYNILPVTGFYSNFHKWKHQSSRRKRRASIANLSYTTAEVKTTSRGWGYSDNTKLITKSASDFFKRAYDIICDDDIHGDDKVKCIDVYMDIVTDFFAEMLSSMLLVDDKFAENKLDHV